MARHRLSVKHFVVCRRIETTIAKPDGPYNLFDLQFLYEIPEDHEWPIRFDSFWLYVRFYNGQGHRNFTVSVVWLDHPLEESEVCHFDFPVVFPQDRVVLSRGWNISNVRYPGPGRYVFRLIDDRSEKILAHEYIIIRKQS